MDHRDYYRVTNPIRALRKETGLTQAELAKRMRKEQSAISRKECGEDTTIGYLAEAARKAGRTLRIRFVGHNAPYYELPASDPRCVSTTSTQFFNFNL